MLALVTLVLKTVLEWLSGHEPVGRGH